MEIILTKDVIHVGRKGDVVKVRDGFARNFLIPQNSAIPSTRANQEFVAEQKIRSTKRHEKEVAQAEKVAEKLNSLKLKIEAQAGEQDKLFGSVTAEDIAQALAQKGHAFDKKHVHLKESIRSLGSYPVTVEIFSQVKATVTVDVVRKN